MIASLGRDYVVKLHMHSGGYYPVRPTPQGESAGGAFFMEENG